MKILKKLPEKTFAQSCIFIVFSWGMMALLLMLSPMSVEFISFSTIFILSFFIALLIAICVWKNLDELRRYFEIILCLNLLTIPVLVSTYLALSLNMPLADKQLIAMDMAIGFDWKTFIAFINQSPKLELLLHIGYSSFGAQLIGLPLLLLFVGQINRAYAFVFGYGLLCFISSFISIWFPANAAYVTFNITANDVPNIHSYFGFEFLNEFNALRSDPDFILRWEKVSGILTFPSVHAGIACLCVWASWSNLYLRIPFLILNAFMFVSAVSHGAHYLVDIFAGALVAVCTVLISSSLFLKRLAKMAVKSLEEVYS